MMHFWTPQNFADVTGGRWLSPPKITTPLRGVSTDSRQIEAGQAFIALRGEKLDGHDYLAAVAKAGATLLIVSEEAKARNIGPDVPGVLLVPDTLVALQSLASAYRDALGQAGCKVIAVAGSNGKTTTRNLIHTVLSAKFRGTQSPKSFNNHIGVPLTLLAAGLEPFPLGRGQGEGTSSFLGDSTRVRPSPISKSPHPNPLPGGEGVRGDDFVVVEIGTNHPGEIAALSKIVQPDVAVVTSIGHEHMEFFKTLDGVAQEEAAILGHVQPGGRAFVPSDVMEQFNRLNLWPPALRGDTYQLSGYRPDGDAQVFPINDSLSVRLPLLGRHNGQNALAAVAVGRWMGLDDAEIASGLERAEPCDMRLNVLRLGPPEQMLVVINDAYNANPSSLSGAIETLVDFPLPSADGRRVVVFGDMFELGDAAPDFHRAVGRKLAACKPTPQNPARTIDAAVFIGKLMMFMAETVSKEWPELRVQAFPNWDDSIPDKIADFLQPGDVVLLKASRGMKLERIMPAVETRFGKQLETAKHE